MTAAGIITIRSTAELSRVLRYQLRHGVISRRTHRRVPRRYPLIRPELDYAIALKRKIKRLRAMIRAALLPRLEAVLDDLGRRHRHDSAELERQDADLLTELLGGVEVAWAQELRLGDLITPIGRRVAGKNDRDLNEQVRSVLAIDLDLHEPWLTPMMDRWAGENAALITGASESVVDAVALSVRQASIDGVRAEDLADDLQAEFLDDDSLGAGKADRRMQLIARDQVGKLNGEISEARQEDIGIERFTWRTSRDERVRESHREREGLIFEWGRPIEEQLLEQGLVPDKLDGIPGVPPLCFPGESKFDVPCFTKKLYRRWYDGELTQLRTHTGKAILGTPNHPILTPRGWVPMGALNLGEHVFDASFKGVGSFEHNEKHDHAGIADVFDALASVIVPVRHHGSRVQFHGDGSDHQVDIVAADGRLPDDWNSALLETLGKQLFAAADAVFNDSILPPSGHLLGALGRMWPAPHGIVRGCGKLLALFGGQSAHPQDAGFGAISRLHAFLEQSAPDALPLHSVLFRNCKFAHAGQVVGGDGFGADVLSIMRRVALAFRRVDTASAEMLGKIVRTDAERLGRGLDGGAISHSPSRIIEKSLCEFSGHVFNLETSSNWYIANGITVHNCRCYAEPILSDLVDDLPDIASPIGSYENEAVAL